MTRYWVSWWTDNYPEDGVASLKGIPMWLTGERGANRKYSLCAVIDAESPLKVTAKVKLHFPDAELRFCHEKEEGWNPPVDRFPRLEGAEGDACAWGGGREMTVRELKESLAPVPDEVEVRFITLDREYGIGSIEFQHNYGRRVIAICSDEEDDA